jgi:translation initiation factor 2B subunit (eIF-2B alpha/beta/delta family)
MKEASKSESNAVIQPSGQAAQLSLSLKELGEMFTIISRLFDAVGAVVKVTSNERKKMRQSLDEACVLIDTVLSVIRQRITSIIKEIRLGDKNVKEHILDLRNIEEWEDQYRKIRICEPLRNTADDLARGVAARVKGKVAFKDPEKLSPAIYNFFAGEEKTAEATGRLLEDLSNLAPVVESNPQFVIQRLEKARDAIEKERMKFMRLEKKIRAHI